MKRRITEGRIQRLRGEESMRRPRGPQTECLCLEMNMISPDLDGLVVYATLKEP